MDELGRRLDAWRHGARGKVKATIFCLITAIKTIDAIIDAAY
jgi:hypothetical protein